jgi:hypothetical protein
VEARLNRPNNLKRDSSGKYAKWPPRHDQRRELHSRRLKSRLFVLIAAFAALFAGVDYAASADAPVADSSALNFKQWGLLAVQDGGRRNPVATFAKETLIRITGRSTYTDKNGRKWQSERFRFVGSAGDARLEKRADGAGLIRQAQGTTRVRQNAAAIFVRAIGWIDQFATACQ